MGKEFYTERDIEDMVQRGERSIVIHDDVVLTDLAYEKAKRLGVELLQPNDVPPAAPVRPYINKPVPSSKTRNSNLGNTFKIDTIRANVKKAVRAKLGSQVSDELLDRIIDRVASELGLK
ncbi:MAG: hypothetical protein E4H27_05670 [Anaerolineales bacterium]|nr:MAG: hypothetical protein E4H27_05670 [Anaerolineales bacterium]